MHAAHEFVDMVPEDLPSVVTRRLGEQIMPLVSRIGQDLAESGGQIEISRIQKRFYPIDPAAVMIALREASEINAIDLDEVDGIIYPPRQQRSLQQRYRYM